MQNAMPMRWIEQAEARQVLTAARFERSPAAPWSSMAGDAAAQILPRLRSWLIERHPLGMPAALYPIAFWLTLVGLLVIGRNSAVEPAPAEARSAPSPSAA